MSSYRYIFLDTPTISRITRIACESDTQVQARADRLLAAYDYPGIEVWDRERQVYRVLKIGTPPQLE